MEKKGPMEEEALTEVSVKLLKTGGYRPEENDRVLITRKVRGNRSMIRGTITTPTEYCPKNPNILEAGGRIKSHKRGKGKASERRNIFGN